MPSLLYRSLIFCALLSCLSFRMIAGFAEVETPVSEDYLLRVWEVDDGLPVNEVQAIAQTPDGYLWLATGFGVARFDGTRFATFTQAHGLESNRAHSLCLRRSGELWVGLERGGVARLRNGRFETVLPMAAQGSGTGYVTSMAEDAEGAMWLGFAGERRVARWHGSAMVDYGEKQGVGPGEETFVHADITGRIWFAAKGGCGVFCEDRFRPIDEQTRAYAKLAPAQAGGVWAANGQSLMRYFEDGRMELAGDLAWLGGSVEVRALFEDDMGSLWIGTRGAGLYRFRDGNFVQVPASHETVLSVAQTSDGNLWAGTRAGGLNGLRPRQLFLRTKQHGLSKDSVAAITLDANGTLWIAPVEGVPARGVFGRNDTFAPVPGWTEGAPVMACAGDHEGNVWFGFLGGGVVRWRDGSFEKINGVPRRIESLFPARDGTIWVAPRGAPLARWKDGNYEEGTGNAELPTARALGEDEAGRIWVGTTGGQVFRREADGRWLPMSTGGLGAGQGIRFFLPDGPDTMWIGTEGGLLRWRAGMVTQLTVASGLPENDTRQMAFDRFDQAWIATARHLCRVKRRDLEAVMNGRSPAIYPILLGRDDGLPNLGFTSGSRHAVARTPDGHLWMATDRGALEIVPQPERPAAPLAPVIIEELRVAGESVPLDGRELKLPPRARQLEVSYTVPRFTSPERLQFRYRLAPSDSEWIDAGTERQAAFNRLPPGRYRLEVAAREFPGEWTAGVATLAFVVQPAWVETLWFRSMAALLGTGGVASMARFIVLRRVRARMRRLEQESALERERARIARDMHDELGASLTRIALLSDLAAFEPESNRVASKRFGEIATAARAVGGTLDEIVWTVNPRNDTVERLVGYLGEFAREYLETAGVAVKLELPSALLATPVASDTRHQVLLGVKETLNNIVKYADATLVTVRLSYDAGELRIVIADDGRGFDVAAVSPNSNGIGNMEQRFAALGGSAQIESRPGAGTIVTFHIPLG